MSDTDQRQAIAEGLRDAASWLRLAAERLEAGQTNEAHSMARMGAFGAEGMPERIAALASDK